MSHDPKSSIDADRTTLGSGAPAPLWPPSSAERPGTMVGRYKLLEEIGEGGFGTVFLAEQREPVLRRVALKVIKLGMDTKQVIARFEAERQALALMDHPGIAKVLDAGSTESGRPYFVMDLVKGEPITDYCDRQQLTIHDRLELFVQVCQAVQHAHQKGVIHRDLKPSNVLVSTENGAPAVKVIDFGIAKATAAKLTDLTLFTELRQLVGTPQYMAPEQAEGSLDIDTRADVYSLGVLLYELLTGSTPLDARALHAAGVADVQRMIREADPPTPSTRISRDTKTLDGAAAQRRTQPARLGALLRGDLDWVVMKALEKDRTRRYETANGLAADLNRHLAGEPVLAAPPSVPYRVGKFVRRNRTLVIATAVVTTAVIVGLAGTVLGLVRAERQRKSAETTARFMQDILDGVSPSVARGRDTTLLRDVLDAAAARIVRGELASAPDAELSLRSSIGSVYTDIGAYAEAHTLLDPAVELAKSVHRGDAAAVAVSLSDLGGLASAEGRWTDAERVLRESVAMFRRVPMTADLPIDVALTHLGYVLTERDDFAGAESVYRESLAIMRQRFPGDSLEVAVALGNLGLVLRKRGDSAAAEQLLRDAIAMRRRVHGDDDANLARNLGNLGAVLTDRGRYAEAASTLHEAIAMARHVLPPDHSDTFALTRMLGEALQFQGQFTEAEAILRESYDGQRRVQGPDHSRVIEAATALGVVLMLEGKLGDAEPLLRDALDRSRRVLGPGNADTLTRADRLATLFQREGRLADAEPLCREALEGRRRLLGRDAAVSLLSANNLGLLLQQEGRLAEAEPFIREGAEGQRRTLGDDNPDALKSMSNLAKLLVDLGRPAEALPIADDVVRRGRVVFKDHFALGNFLGKQGVTLTALGRFADAEKALLEGYGILAAKLGERHEQTLRLTGYLAALYEKWNDAEPSASHRSQAAAWSARVKSGG